LFCCTSIQQVVQTFCGILDSVVHIIEYCRNKPLLRHR
jgi:hypothetical protein